MTSSANRPRADLLPHVLHQLVYTVRRAQVGLLESVNVPLGQVSTAISTRDGSDLAYLQLALMRLSTRVAERISSAEGHEVAIWVLQRLHKPVPPHRVWRRTCPNAGYQIWRCWIPAGPQCSDHQPQVKS